MKNKKGVSMIELVIVIIIILIITTFAVFSGRESVEQATITELYSEMNAMKGIINSFNIKQEIDQNFNSGDYYGKKASEVYSENELITIYNYDMESGDYENLYIIYGMDNEDYNENNEYKYNIVKDSYGLESIKHTYITASIGATICPVLITSHTP